MGEKLNGKIKFFIICIALSLFCFAAVSASDNATDHISTDAQPVKDTPVISLNASKVYTGKSVSISLKDSNNTAIAGEDLTANIDNQNYSLKTNKKGSASLALNLKADNYILNVIYGGNDNYSGVSQTFNINVLKLPSSITPVDTTVFKYKYFYVYLKDSYGNAVKEGDVTFTVNGQKYTAKTNSQGKAGLKISLTPNSVYSMKIYFAGNDYYKSVSKTVSLTVPAVTSLVIGNTKLLTNGFLRVYLKGDTISAVSNKAVKITIGSKSYTKTTNSEGIIIFKPKVKAGKYTIKVKFAGSSTIISSNATKIVKCINGNIKNPQKTKIPLVNGTPDIDVMPGNYVMADGDGKYTLLKAQYQNVIKRDSQYLYLTNKLSKYVFFKTKSEPNLNHIIPREKWNVIERAVNTKIVLKNKHNYWPGSVTVSLKGKSYSYPDVRDIQDTDYTCGPTSGSMCSQVLKSYVCEKQIAKLSGSSYIYGTTCKQLKKGLEKCNFKCSYFYKSTFDKALNQLKKGGCALVFHTWSHYVAILDISADGKKVLVGNPSGDYNLGSHSIPTKWLTVSYMKKMFNNYDTSSLIVKLKYSLSSSAKSKLKNTYSSMGAGWVAKNTSEIIPQINNPDYYWA